LNSEREARARVARVAREQEREGERASERAREREQEGFGFNKYLVKANAGPPPPPPPVSQSLTAVLDGRLAPLRYVDDDCALTEAYPYNPNGSPHGIAALW